MYILLDESNKVYKTLATNPQYVYPAHIAIQFIEVDNENIQEGWIYENGEFKAPELPPVQPDPIADAYLAIATLYEELEALKNG